MSISPDELEFLDLHARPLLGADRETKVYFKRLSGGRNNRVFRVELEDRKLCVKWYCDGTRDRLGAEFLFAKWCEASGASAPRPICCDPKNRLAAYSLVPGERISAAQVDAECCQQALEFLSCVNADRDLKRKAISLPNGAEASFSIEDHFATVERRLSGLLAITAEDNSAREAKGLLESTLVPAFDQQKRIVRVAAEAAGFNWSESLSDVDRIVSPSDFGFHNALRDSTGRLTFLDFEHAGWDDPAKTICDALCQIEVPFPAGQRDSIVSGVAELGGNAEQVRWRSRQLLPLYQLKWCCILLNEFLPQERSRREFAGGAQRTDFAEQLAKAAAMAARIGKTS